MSETIVALSSGHIKAAISLIRLSGDDAFTIISKIFKGNSKTHEHQKIYHGKIIDNNQIVDDVMVAFYENPKTFTGEDMVEIFCHGNFLIINKIIELCVANKARLATKGEFTKRAYLNGKLNLVNAEAINDLINADNNQAVKLALNGLGSATTAYIKDISNSILDVLTHIEVNIDYPEYDELEEMTHENIKPLIVKQIEMIEKAIKDTHKGQIIKDGINTVIVGKPNVGKSSLLNALLGENKAIVTSIAGTTRDQVEGRIEINGLTLNLIDTAGIRKGENIIESIGIEKTFESLEKAELVILVFDNSQKLQKEDFELLDKTKGKKRIIVLNKTDLGKVNDIVDSVTISAAKNDIDNLINKISELFKDYTYNNEPLLFNARQKGLLLNCKQHLNDALNQCLNNQVIDIISIDVKEAYNCLLQILGNNDFDMIDNIFSKFCLGK